jgi:CheY-like chemotaxis protein
MAGETILIVEDECLMGSLLKEALEDAGYVALFTHSADEAIPILEFRTDISVIVTDIHMPGSMDGLKLSAAVRDRWPPIKIIVMSGDVQPSEEELPDGAVFLNKPFQMDAMRGALDDLL